jgi:hypothetical protein
MLDRMPTSRAGGPALVGLLFVVLGVAALSLRWAGVDLGAAVGERGWPLFVLGPGLVLLALAFVAPAPGGAALAIGGAAVTTVGAILAYQNWSDHWESWAYVWALIPAGVGLGMAVYGWASHQGDLLRLGPRLVVVGLAIFAIGFWFFESTFERGRAPLDLGTWWPVVAVVGGIVLMAVARLGRRAPAVGRAGGDGVHRDSPI